MSGHTGKDPSTNVKTIRQPPPLPQYEVLGYLGGGGMGEIYKARHVHLDRVVVVKWLRSDVPVSPQMEKRFAREMLAVGQVTHANVVNATDAGIVDGRRYLVMEYIDGVDLSALRKCVGPLPIAEACEIVRQAATGLAQAHRRGIVHRDVKPTNIMVAGDGCVKILDLGLALLQHEGDAEEHTLTSADSGPFGTYDYMSPEQWGDTHNVDHRTDLYSIGCTLYFLLCGHAPFATEKHSTPASKMRGHVLEEVPRVEDLRPDVPDELKRLIDRLLVKDPDQRLGSADELAEALLPFTEGCDLKNLVASAHGGSLPGVNSTTNPESQTILVGSSHQDGSRKSTRPGHAALEAKTADGNETKWGRSKTLIDGPRPASESNRAARWLFAGTVAAALLTAGAAASLYVVMNSGDRDEPPGETLVDVTPAEETTSEVEQSDRGEQVPATAPEEPQSDSDPADEPVETVTTPPIVADTVMPVPMTVPEFEPLPLQELRENEPVTVLVTLREFQALRGKVAFEVGRNAPTGMRIDAETGVIRWQPGEDQGGTDTEFEVTVLARSLDSTVESAETTVRFSVAEVNQPPRLAQVGDAEPGEEDAGRFSATEGKPFELAVVLDDVDYPRNLLDLSPIGSLPEGARLVRDENGDRTWKLTWTPAERHGGGEDVLVRLRADDGMAHADLAPIRIAVAEVNEPPVIASVNGAPFNPDAPWKADVAEGQPLELTIAASDVDLPPNDLTLSAVGELPAGARLGPVQPQSRTWKLTWTPDEAQGGVGPFTIRLRAGDDEATSAVSAVVVTVAEVNVAPVLTTINGADLRERPEFAFAAREGRPLELTLVAADTDLPPNPLSIEPVDPLPDGAQLTEVDGERGTLRLNWTPDEAIGGSGRDVRIPVRVFDGTAHSETRTIVVRVDEVNAAPELASIGGEALSRERRHSVAVKEGEQLSLAIVGTDDDLPGNPLTLTAGDLPEGARIVPDEDDPRLWRLIWTPTEVQGGYAPFEIPIQVRDSETGSREAKLLVRVDEVNVQPTIADIKPQSAGPGEEFVLDIEIADPDRPRQELSFEIEQPDGFDARLAWAPVEDGPPDTLRFTWSPDFDRDRGTDREFTVRITDNGDPPLSATRTFQVYVGRYVTNSIGMQLALLPAGDFRMGNLNPEQLELLVPKIPEVPQEGNPQPGSRPPFGNQPVRPGAPSAPSNPTGVPGAQPGTEERPAEETVEEVTPDDVPVRELPVTQAFYMGAFEVTQAQFLAVMGENPSYFAADGPGGRMVADLDPGNLPVETVTYAQAMEFCRRLSELPDEQERGLIYRLPSEIEWEYACRAGSETMYHTGERLSSTEANFDGRYPARGTRPGPYLRRSTTVGSYAPNDFGLHDMHGNVGEWCFDWYAPDAYEQDFDWFGPKEGEQRVVRGGSYHSQRAHHTRSAARDARDPAAGSPRIGFRVVCELIGARPIGAGQPVPDPQPDEPSTATPR